MYFYEQIHNEYCELLPNFVSYDGFQKKLHLISITYTQLILHLPNSQSVIIL